MICLLDLFNYIYSCPLCIVKILGNENVCNLWHVRSISQMCVYVLSHSAVSNSLQPYRLQSARLLCPWDFAGENTGVGCHALLQGIFLILII